MPPSSPRAVVDSRDPDILEGQPRIWRCPWIWLACCLSQDESGVVGLGRTTVLSALPSPSY